ncbi:hypothetical protein AMTR_s00045p00202660, partial [Amborella trichopoda]
MKLKGISVSDRSLQELGKCAGCEIDRWRLPGQNIVRRHSKASESLPLQLGALRGLAYVEQMPPSGHYPCKYAIGQWQEHSLLGRPLARVTNTQSLLSKTICFDSEAGNKVVL